MQYNRRTVTSRSGMSQEDALLGLQNHPEFKAGSTISGVRRRGDRWVISILEPKEAALPFEMDEKEEKEDNPFEAMDAMDEKSDDHEEKESPMEEKLEHDKPEPSDKPHEDKSELSEIKELVKDVKKIIDALGINNEEPKAPGMDDVPAPKPASPPAPPKPAEKEKEVTLNKSMRPGEAPPGTVNVGSPAFASTNKVASFTATSDDTFGSIKEAKASLDAEFGPQGYKVKQLRRSEGKIHALMSVR